LQVVLDAKIHDLEFDLENAATAVVTSEVVGFLVSMEVASRKGLLLVVDYGNGDNRKYFLGDDTQGNDTLTTTEEQVDGNVEFTEIAIRGGYGEGCILVVELHHIYRYEGVYVPHIVVSNNHSSSSVELSPSIIAQPRLEEVYVPLERSIIAANESFRLQAVVIPNIVNVSMIWNITDLYAADTNQSNGDLILVTNKHLIHTFVSASTYDVNLTARNLVSNVSTQFMLQTELPLSDLELTYNKVRRYVRVGEQVTFYARIAQGSNVDFGWDFGESHQGQGQPIYGETVSTATHSFTKPGMFNVSIKAYNPLGQLTKTLSKPIIAQDVITNLVLQLPPAAAKSRTVDVVAMVTTGTDVHFDFDYGNGRRPANQIPSNGQVTESHVFDSLAVFNVTVYSYNEVSAANRSVCVEVQEVIDDIVLTKIFEPVQKKPVVFLVQSYGKILCHIKLL
jgi:PKD repeat protein